VGGLDLNPILGRDRELRALEGLIVELSANAGLLLAGEPGIGTSTLLDAAGRRATAQGVRVLSARGVARDRDRPAAGLEQVLGLLRDQRGPDLRSSLEDLATEALSAAAGDRPTLLLIDDGDLVDELSWRALTHAARSLYDRPFTLVAALSEGSARVRGEGLPVLTVGPLSEADARAVLAGAAEALPTFVIERIVMAAAGNPMALVELASSTPTQWRRQCVRPPIALPLSPRLVQAFAEEVEQLPAATQEVLLAAAANDSPALSEAVHAAAATLRVDTEVTLAACLAAFERRIVEGDAVTIRFRSEAAGSAIYQAASLPRRHAIHMALAHLLADDPHRAAWHRAAASLKPDEELAVELSSAATAVRDHGRIRDALATMDRAARVSQDPVARVPRLLDAAEMAFEIGRPDFVTTFLGQATQSAQSAEHRQRISRVQALYDPWRPDDGSRARALIAAAEAAHAAGEEAQTAIALTRLTETCNVIASARMPRADLLSAAERLGGIEATPALVGPLAVACPVEHGAEILRHARGVSPDADGNARVAMLHAEAAAALGDDQLAVAFYAGTVECLRLEGRLGLLPAALLGRARAYFATAGHDLARADVAEGLRLAMETAQPIVVGRFKALDALLVGAAGDLARSLALAEEAERAALARQALLVDVHLARGCARLAAGDHEEALVWFLRLWADELPQIARSRRWAAIAELAETAAALERADEVRPLVEHLAVTAAAVPSPLLRLTVAHARAMLDPDEADAEDDLLAARDASVQRGPFPAGRAHLAYGAWLRRRRRVSEARLELRAAVASFEAAGAGGWSARARAELRAAGTPTAVDPATALDALTAQERQIAELAAAGLSNREIGARMFLSPRTISTHLYRVFPKLGVTSRAQLRAALDALADGEATAAPDAQEAASS
jgi:DNA-binding CsgD family transcriptional regulator